MKYLVLSATLLAFSASLSAASASNGYECARFQSAHEIRMTSGAQQACPERYVQLRMLEERNESKPERKKEEQVTLGAWHVAPTA